MPLLGASQVGNDRFLHGRPYLFSLGLYDHRARFYEPGTQTFLEPDPLGPVDSPNLYQAFGWDGLNVTDPWGESFRTFMQGVGEGLVNLGLGLIQMGMRATNPATAAEPIQYSVNFTDPNRPTVVTSLRDPKEEVEAATVVIPVGEMLGRFSGNAYLTAEGLFDETAPQGYLDEVHADLGRDTPGIALTVLPLPKVARTARARGRTLSDGASVAPLVRDVRAISASEANAPFVAKGWNAPYEAGTRVRKFKTARELDFVRVHGANNPTGLFLVRPKEVAGMTPAQIQQHLGLPSVPTQFRTVRVPEGTSMQMGRVAAQPDFGVSNTGGVQYQLLERIPDSAFGPSVPLS